MPGITADWLVQQIANFNNIEIRLAALVSEAKESRNFWVKKCAEAEDDLKCHRAAKKELEWMLQNIIDKEVNDDDKGRG